MNLIFSFCFGIKENDKTVLFNIFLNSVAKMKYQQDLFVGRDDSRWVK